MGVLTEQQWLKDNQLSIDIWNKKYRYGDESFEQWLYRVSGGNSEVRDLILQKRFIFGGRILANRGLAQKGRKITLSNCYVIPAPEDNLESIFQCGANLARTYSYGGGCGIDISKLRPKGSAVNNAAKTTSGTISFMDFFSYVTGLIGQEGRRGALMISISCDHPDLEEFINLKTDLELCTKANISVRVTDEFMQAVIADEPWTLSFNGPHSLIMKKVQARDIFYLLAKRNWEMAEPGVLYWDTIKHYNMLNTDPDFHYDGVNPCAEEPLPAGGSCLLGSINLSEFVLHPFEGPNRARVDTIGLEYAVDVAVEALNAVLDEGQPLHPLEVQRQSVQDWRQIGLGTMGLGDMLIKLGLPYGSPESITLITYVFSCIAKQAVKTSLRLAQTQGCYNKCNKERLVESAFIQNLNLSEEMLHDIKLYGLRNSQLLTCAPTGTIGTMLQVSTGVEPNYALRYTRRTVSLNSEETYYMVDADIVKQYREYMHDEDGSLELPDYFVGAQVIPPMDRIAVQAALQKWIDAAISSTINLPETATVDDVFNIYIEAWKQGLKGVTIWRDNCQRQSILSVNEQPANQPDGPVPWNGPQRGEIIKAGENCIGLKRTLMTGCGTLHCEAFFDPDTGEFRECYLSKGSTGGCNNFMIGLSRMMSLAARGGISLENILDQLKSCGTCPSYAVRRATQKDTSKGSCCPVAVGNALKEMHTEIQQIICDCQMGKGITIGEAEIAKMKPFVTSVHVEGTPSNIPEQSVQSLEECPSCHEKSLTRQGGCVSCPSCGWSRCS